MELENLYLILGMAAVTFLTRSLFLTAVKDPSFSPRTINWLRYVPLAVLTSLVMSPVAAPQGNLDISFGNEFLLAAVVTAFMAQRTKNSAASIVAGMVTVVLLRLPWL